MARNFYVVLGVSRDADHSQIRNAHRRLVRLYHPDTGTGSIEKFTEVQKAYETLADKEAKRLYDESLPPERPIHTRVQPAPKPARIQNSDLGLFSDIDDFLGGWLPGFFTTGRTASRRKDLYVEIVLDPEEAARGGLFPLKIPVYEKCNECGASGYVGVFLCTSCGGNGVVQTHREIEISMPARVTDGTRARLS